MILCSAGHEEICFISGTCLVCDLKQEIIRLDIEISDLNEEVKFWKEKAEKKDKI